MKKVIAVAMVSLSVLGGVAPVSAKVDTQDERRGTSDLKLTIVDGTPHELRLVNVPETFEQTAKLTAGIHTVDFFAADLDIKDDSVDRPENAATAPLLNKYAVFNNDSTKGWKLEASLNPDKVTAEGVTTPDAGAKTVTITEFKLEDQLIFGAGTLSPTIFSKAADAADNSGYITMDFNKGQLKFKDHKGHLETGDKIDVTDLVVYNLSNTGGAIN